MHKESWFDCSVEKILLNTTAFGILIGVDMQLATSKFWTDSLFENLIWKISEWSDYSMPVSVIGSKEI